MIEFYHHLPAIIRWPLEFMFFVVFLRGIVANELNKEIRKYWNLFWSKERHAAALQHYRQRLLGQGHATQSALDCRQDNCAIYGR